jgi:hypothetical protein
LLQYSSVDTCGMCLPIGFVLLYYVDASLNLMISFPLCTALRSFKLFHVEKCSVAASITSGWFLHGVYKVISLFASAVAPDNSVSSACSEMNKYGSSPYGPDARSPYLAGPLCLLT